eukprot:TRINITY_DN26120_c0_g1_i1.p1 TRINITY_DN26120_c0_g1~~TRINITY_DN26120_c0_g1_i1.p1  ORF type:complete len:135 (+),score=13.20 TRINITY_DN26120_c0_g1_i1:83-487(+)
MGNVNLGNYLDNRLCVSTGSILSESSFLHLASTQADTYPNQEELQKNHSYCAGLAILSFATRSLLNNISGNYATQERREEEKIKSLLGLFSRQDPFVASSLIPVILQFIKGEQIESIANTYNCLLYTSPSPRDS